MKLLSFLPILFAFFVLTSCGKSYLERVLKNNPEILIEFIENNPKEVISALNNASIKLRREQIQKEAEERAQARNSEFKNPKKPLVSKSRAIFGNKKAPITVVKYSDFQCGYCARAVSTVERILKTYKNKVRFVYKHLPLDYHKQAYLAAQYYESVAKESPRKAESFYKKLFANQRALSQGATFMDKLVREVGLKPSRVKKHFKSVRKIIDSDIAEARKFDFNGTPAFIVGGVTLRGAQPFSEFQSVIDRHIRDKKI